MLPIHSEKALRKLVMELATATTEDIAAVLAMLDDRSAAMVRALLAAYTDVGDVFELKAPPPVAHLSGFSDFLAARISGRPLFDDDYVITPKTAETLRALAGSLTVDGARA